MKKIVFDHIDFADSEFSNFELLQNIDALKIRLISWDERELILFFQNPIQFVFKQGDVVSNLYECMQNTPFLQEALSINYTKLPTEHPFKLFQLYDIDDFPFIEVVAESVRITKGTEIVGFD